MRCFCLSFLIMTGLASCYTPRYVYSPSAHNVPAFTEKNESKLGAYYSSNLTQKSIRNNQRKINKGAGLDVQGAYAISKRFAVQASYFNRTEQNEGSFSFFIRDSAAIRYRRNLTEAGFGYYTKMNEPGTAFFQLFAGIGTGRFKFTDNGIDQNNVAFAKYFNTKVTKFYLQPAIMVNYRKLITFSFSSRFSLLDFHNMRTNYTAPELNNYRLDSIGHSPVVFWEPAFVNSFAFKKLTGVLFEYQTGLSLLLSKRFLDARTFNFSIGAFMDIPKLLRLKSKDAKKEQ